MHCALEASQHAYGSQVARAAELEQQVNQLTIQLAELQETLSTGEQQQAKLLQQQLGKSQDKLCSTEQQLLRLQDSSDTLQAQVGHQCTANLDNAAETGRACNTKERNIKIVASGSQKQPASSSAEQCTW